MQVRLLKPIASEMKRLAKVNQRSVPKEVNRALFIYTASLAAVRDGRKAK